MRLGCSVCVLFFCWISAVFAKRVLRRKSQRVLQTRSNVDPKSMNIGANSVQNRYKSQTWAVQKTIKKQLAPGRVRNLEILDFRSPRGPQEEPKSSKNQKNGIQNLCLFERPPELHCSEIGTRKWSHTESNIDENSSPEGTGSAGRKTSILERPRAAAS